MWEELWGGEERKRGRKKEFSQFIIYSRKLSKNTNIVKCAPTV